MQGEKSPLGIIALVMVGLATYGVAQRVMSAGSNPPAVDQTTITSPAQSEAPVGRPHRAEGLAAPPPDSTQEQSSAPTDEVAPMEIQAPAGESGTAKPSAPATTAPPANSAQSAPTQGPAPDTGYSLNFTPPTDDATYPPFTNQDLQSIVVNGQPLFPVWNYTDPATNADIWYGNGGGDDTNGNGATVNTFPPGSGGQ